MSIPARPSGRFGIRIGEALVAGGPPGTAAEPEVAIGEMDGVTQQNAALGEEAAAAAESLRQQAERLAEVFGVFQVAPGLHAGRPQLALAA